ncbi:hypothetical protein B0H14DRAFT_3467725 [Mycena olivaceomarginata]|nr:hypothetical protein B0H14DRAFT_3467725 [Mycena olivaceomarginata]
MDNAMLLPGMKPGTPLVLSDCPLGQKVVRAAGNRCGHGLELGPKGLKKILKDITRALREDPVIANDTRFYSLHGHRSPAKGSGKTSAEKAAEEAVEAEQPQHAPTGTLLAQKVKTDSPGQFTKLPAKDGPKGSSATDSDTHYGASPSHLGLPTVPVFTGVTGAVNGMPSRPVKPLPDKICGTWTGRQNSRPSRQGAVVDGR